MTRNGQKRRTKHATVKERPPLPWEGPVSHWLRALTGSRKPTTVKDSRSRIGILRRWAEAQGLTLDAFKTRHLVEFLAVRADAGLADTSRRHDAIIAKAFLKWAFLEGYLTSNPLQGYIIPKAQTPPRYVPPAEDVRRLLAAIPDSWNVHKNPPARFVYDKARRFFAARDAAIIMGLVATGCRIGEMLALRLDDWRPDRSEVLLRWTKSGKPRAVPISPLWQEAVETYMTRRPRCDNPFLFINADGGSWDAKGEYRALPMTTWAKSWQRYMNFAGLTGWSCHNLRHYVGTYIAVDRGDLMTASALLGHADLKTTRIYAHNSAQQLQEAYAAADPLRSVLINTRSQAGKRKIL